MTILVAFATAHGSTQGIAERIAQHLNGQGVDAVALSIEAPLDPQGYSGVVVGSAIQNGKWLPIASEWVRQNASTIATVPCWLFSVSTIGDEESAFAPKVAGVMRRARKETKEITAIRRFLRARGHRNFAGAIQGEHWSRAGRWFMKIFRGKMGDHRNWPAIDAWANEIAREVGRAA